MALRRFIEKERLVRKQERELQLLHLQDQHQDQGEDQVQDDGDVHDVTSNDLGDDISVHNDHHEGTKSNNEKEVQTIESNSENKMNEQLLPPYHEQVLKDRNGNPTVEIGSDKGRETETQYEGPPAMDEDEPTYSAIKKKMSSPVKYKGRKSNTVMMMEQSLDLLHAEPDPGDDASCNANTSVKNNTHANLIDTDTPNPTQTKPTMTVHSKPIESSSMTKTTNSFFFVPIQDYTEPPPTPQAIPLITLGTFAESAWLEFGDERMNVVGKSKSLPFDLHVPEDGKLDEFRVQVERVPTRKGFTLGIVCGDKDREEENGNVIDGSTGLNSSMNLSDVDTGADESSSTHFTVKRGETKRLFLTWTPLEPGGVCEVVYLKLKRGRVRVTARGHARGKGGKELKKVKKVSECEHFLDFVTSLY